MSQSTRLTVQEYAESIGKSKQSVYNRIKRGTLESTTVDKQVYVLVDENVDQRDNQVNEVNQPLNNPIENIDKPTEISPEQKEIKSLKKEIKKLRKIIDTKDQEVKDLLERIITLESNQKNEIIQQQHKQHQELKMYMEFIQKQSENVLPPMQEDKHTKKYDDVIDADIQKDKKKKKKKDKKDKKNK